MKKIFLFTLLMALIFSASVRNCEAKDVWVAHWNYENLDIYVMDDTINPTESGQQNYFSVSTKQVRNGKLIQTITWKFSKWREDMWRYETNTMDGKHTTVVIPRNGIFEFCMNSLGWTYQIRENGGLKYY